MKKIVKPFLMIIIMGLTFLNANQLKSNEGDLTLGSLMQNAYASGECGLYIGQDFSGTNCYVYDILGEDEYYFMFDIYACFTTQCTLGGTNCCYIVHHR